MEDIKPLQFSKPEVAEKFEPLVEQDRQVHRQQVYSGPLSGITLKMAEAMVKGGSNLIKPKEQPAQKAAPVKEETKK